MDIPSETICSSCHSIIPSTAYFCPNCGKPVKNKAPATSLSKQIAVYAVSLFLPPFGLLYAWKYSKETDNKSKKIAAAATVLTVISIIITIWTTEIFINSLNQSLNSINNLNF